jgi:hypothetical protein
VSAAAAARLARIPDRLSLIPARLERAIDRLI